MHDDEHLLESDDELEEELDDDDLADFPEIAEEDEAM